jgi:hypothetical protein
MEDPTLLPGKSRIIHGMLIVLTAIALAGCAAPSGNLRLVSVDQKHEFVQNFTQAYISRNESGDADIVLVEDNIHPSAGDPNKPQRPDPAVMPRELVHVRVFWTPMSGVKADHPANTNASIHWCFICDSAAQPGVMEYCGSGLVVVSQTSDGAKITIRKAWMKEGCQHGQLVDPLGPCNLYGTFRATRDDTEVKSVIAQIKSAATSNTEAQANTVSPVN